MDVTGGSQIQTHEAEGKPELLEKGLATEADHDPTLEVDPAHDAGRLHGQDRHHVAAEAFQDVDVTWLTARKLLWKQQMMKNKWRPTLKGKETESQTLTGLKE